MSSVLRFASARRLVAALALVVAVPTNARTSHSSWASRSSWADAAAVPAGDELERGWRREPAASSAAPWARSRSPTTAHPPVDVRLSRSGLHAPVASVQGLIGRLLGAPRVASFALEVIPADPATGNDVFELDYDAAQQLVVVRGNAGYSIAAGLNWYLKYSLNCSFSWGRGGSGNNVAGVPPAGALPPPAGGPVRMAAPVRWRYAYNVCTFGYTMPFWDFAQFEEELDRLALWGVSLPLAFQGQEFTVDRFYRSPVGGGLNDSAINDFLAGPAFLPWNRMGNMQKWGGPLTPDWLAQQHTLQTRIVTRAREFGMVPVLPGFAGHVPRALVSRFPNATFTSSPDWCGFQPQYGSDTLLEATDPLFATLGAAFNGMIHADFGDPTGLETPVFNADMFNEMEPNSPDLDYLKRSNAAVWQAMTAVDARAVYMMQAWLFHESFWTFDRVQAFLSGVPVGSMIVLDLNTEAGPVWNLFDSFFGHAWIWNSLITYGGRRGIYGDLDNLAALPYADHKASPNMAGVGFTPEATEEIPSQFDIALEAGWRAAAIEDPAAWMRAWAARRYAPARRGAPPSPLLAAASDVLVAACYNRPIDTASLEERPTVGDAMDHNTNATGVLAALRLYVAAAGAGEVDALAGPFSYDLTDVSRQFHVNLFSDAHAMLAARFGRGQPAAASVAALVAFIYSLIDSLDATLAADANFLLGTWIADAARWGGADAAWTDLLVFNARNQVTLWGPRGEINDYAAKHWADLVGGYYKPRWAITLDAMVAAAAAGAPLNQTAVTAATAAFEVAWGARTAERPPTAPSGAAPVALAAAALARFAPGGGGGGGAPPAGYTALPGVDVAPPPPAPTNFVHFGGPGDAAVSDDCPYTAHGDGSSLAACEASCLAVPDACNAVNFSPAVYKDCVHRNCVDPLHAQLTPGNADYLYYGRNVTTPGARIFSAWHTDAGVLAALCDADPACAGFNSAGDVFLNVTATVPAPGRVLYVRAA